MSTTEGNKAEAKLTKEEAKGLAELYRSMLDAYGQFSETLGRIQLTHGEAYAAMFSLESAAALPEMLSQLSGTRPELSKLLTAIFVKMATLLPRLGNLMNLPATDKIQLGESLRLLARDFAELINWIEKVDE
jgi:hypothetical protein